MKMSMLLLIGLSTLLLGANVYAAGAAPFKTSYYTEIKYNKCMTVDHYTWHGDPIDWFVQECPGFAGYKVIKKGGDARSWYVLKYGVKTIDLSSAILTNHTFGQFPNVKETMFEWRTEVRDGQAAPYAAIFRLEAQHPVTMALSTKLMVVRLNAGFGCVIGLRNTNIGARNLADDLTKPCL